MKKRSFSFQLFLFVIATVLTTVACSSDSSSDEENYTFVPMAERPSWQVDLSGNEEMPTWQDPAQSENYMYLTIKLQDELVPYSTNNDRMATFREDECCSIVSHRSVHQDGSIYFVLKIHGNTAKVDLLTLKYYSGGLRQMFSMIREIPFLADYSFGSDENDLVPPLITGCKKYPVYTEYDTADLQLPAEPTDDDLIGAFVGGECRGVCKPGNTLTILGLLEGEQAELRYYSAAKGGIYTFKEKVQISNNQ